MLAQCIPAGHTELDACRHQKILPVYVHFRRSNPPDEEVDAPQTRYMQSRSPPDKENSAS